MFVLFSFGIAHALTVSTVPSYGKIRAVVFNENYTTYNLTVIYNGNTIAEYNVSNPYGVTTINVTWIPSATITINANSGNNTSFYVLTISSTYTHVGNKNTVIKSPPVGGIISLFVITLAIAMLSLYYTLKIRNIMISYILVFLSIVLTIVGFVSFQYYPAVNTISYMTYQMPYTSSVSTSSAITMKTNPYVSLFYISLAIDVIIAILNALLIIFKGVENFGFEVM